MECDLVRPHVGTRVPPAPAVSTSCLENRQAPTTYSKICFWEDDLSQPRFVMMGGADLPLIKAQKNYTAFGASEKRFLHHARDPGPEGVRGTGLPSDGDSPTKHARITTNKKHPQ